jgi:large subunit ribosomal protein L6
VEKSYSTFGNLHIMSRVGKQIINIPAGTQVTYTNGNLTVKGPKGELKRDFHHTVEIKIENNQVTLNPVKKDNHTTSLWGTYASHICNMIEGVNSQFTKKLILEGIGFKCEVAGTKLNLALGFSHPIVKDIPEGITVVSEKGSVTITGCNKETVTQFASQIRALKKPEPYKGKGFRYDNEVIKRKQGKKAS